MEYLQKHQITTREQLLEHRKLLEAQVLELTKERYRLYRREPDCERIHQITEQLKPLRKEIRLCIRIDQHSREIEEKMQQAEQLEMSSTEREQRHQEESR